MAMEALHCARHAPIWIEGDHDTLANHLAIDPDALVLDLPRLHQLRARAMGCRIWLGSIFDSALVDKGFFLIDEIVKRGDIFVRLNRNEI
jgi:hypothetical protein